MRLFHERYCRCDRRRSKWLILLFVTLFNFGLGLFLISSAVSIAENPAKIEKDVSNVEDEMMDIEETNSRRNDLKDKLSQSRHEYYFRIDYTIVQSVCKPLDIFNRTENLISIKNLTNFKIQSLLNQNVTIHFDIISLNPILIRTEKIRQNQMHRSSKTLCDYLLQLYLTMDFLSSSSSFCNKQCRDKEIEHLTSQIHPFGDPVEGPFFFFLYFNNQYQSFIPMNINQMFIYQTTAYLDQSVYIRSLYENRYVSALILDGDAYQSSITMSKIDRSLFLIKDGLDQNIFQRDSKTIFISFLSTIGEQIYLRHQGGRIKLGKYHQIHLFKQDATFKLLFSQKKKDLVAFQSINLPHFYIAVDPETHAALVLERPQQIHTDIELFQQRFLFQFVYP